VRGCKRWVLAAGFAAIAVGCQRAAIAPLTVPAATTGTASPVLAPDLSATLALAPPQGAPSTQEPVVPSATSVSIATAAPTQAPMHVSASTAAASNPYSPHLVAIDPGHGGIDLGARHFGLDGNMDFHESTVTLELAQRVAVELRSRGYRIMMTRDGDFLPNRSEDDLNADGEFTYRDDLLWRVRSINECGAELLLSLHQNAWADDDAELVRSTGGCTTYYCPDREFGASNLAFGTLVQEKVLAAVRGLGYDLFDRGVQPDDSLAVPGESGIHLIILGPQDDVIRWASTMPGALSEPFFITCDAEAALMRKPEMQQRLADAYADAVDAYFGLSS
jgi:N-acetylmuramoyl-L-alanine amidase